MIEQFTITVFTENRTGILSRVVGIITRRHINIETLTVSKSSKEGIHRFTICAELVEANVKKLVAQIEKQVDVVKAFYYRNEEIVYQEIALYKVPIESMHNARARRAAYRTKRLKMKGQRTGERTGPVSFGRMHHHPG